MHAHHHTHDILNTSDRNLVIAVGVNVLLTVVQIIGGLISGSLSLIADAIHNLSDAASLGIALFARIIARRPPDAFSRATGRCLLPAQGSCACRRL